jgi:hypothetical protein
VKSKRAIVVQAADETEARRKAAAELDTPPSNVRLEAKGKGKFQALPVNMDGDVRVKISDDGMEAKVVEVLEPLGDGGWPSPETLASSLRAQGVEVADQAALAELAAKLTRQESVKGLVAARGRGPVEPKDAEVEYDGDPKYPVLRGDHVGRKIPPRPAEEGVKVTGEELPPEDPSDPKDLVLADKYFALDPETGEFSAKGYGMLKLKDGELTIRPLLKVTDNKLAIKGVIHHKTFKGEGLNAGKYRHLLKQMGVAVDAEDKAVVEAIDRARAEDEPIKDVILARGRPPEEGRDGHFELLVETRKKKAPEEGEKVDHRERSAFLSVKEGETVGRLHLPVRGKSGEDVFGNEIKPPEVSFVTVEPGEGVTVSEDGRDFIATASGMVSWQGEKLSVVDALDIEGDVDYSTGNVRLEKGSVRVRGTVRDGFTVETPEDIAIAGSIEGARVTAKNGGVTVAGGIVTGGGGLITAGASVRASFAENAEIRAGGDVVVAQNMTNCRITAGGKVICTSGKGLIQGGEIAATGGAEANEIGSEYGVKTLFILGPQEEECRVEAEVLAERKKLRESIDKIDNALGGSDPKEILQRTPEEKRPKVAQIIKARIAAADKLNEIEERIREENLKRMESCASARLKFRTKAWPGTTVRIMGNTYTLEEPAEASTISFNPRTMEFEVK